MQPFTNVCPIHFIAAGCNGSIADESSPRIAAAWRRRQLSWLARIPACPTSSAVSSFGGASDAMPPLDSTSACAIRRAPGEKYNSKARPALPQENIAASFGFNAAIQSFSNAV